MGFSGRKSIFKRLRGRLSGWESSGKVVTYSIKYILQKGFYTRINLDYI